MSFMDRGPADTVLALALTHHLAISNNLPLGRIANFFSAVCSKWLVIEFVPKQDSMVQKLLAMRDDIFPAYNQSSFEEAFKEHFEIQRAEPIRATGRNLYLMAKR